MKILCAGLTVCDLLFKPMNVQVLQRDTSTAEDIKLAGGGDAFNVAMNLAALGEKPELFTKIGEDDFGEYLLQKLQKSGVGAMWCKRVKIPTSASGVFIKENGERSFLSYKGACHSLRKVDFVEECFDEVTHFYLGSAFDLPELDGKAMAEVLENAQKRGIKTILDTTGEPKAEDMAWFSEVLKYVDYFLPSWREAKLLTDCKTPENAAKKFQECGVKTVVIKLGEEGCLVQEKKMEKRIPAFQVKAIDTTGAGDAFVAGFIRALMHGCSAEKCAEYGNVIGSLAVEHLGASGHAYSEEEIERRMRNVTRFKISKSEEK